MEINCNFLNAVCSFHLFTRCPSHVLLCPADSSMAWLTEVVLLGSSDARLAELSLSEETRTLLELAMGSSRGPAAGLWRKLEEYAHSKGTLTFTCLFVCMSTHLFIM